MFTKVLLSTALAVVLFSGCGGGGASSSNSSSTTISGKVVDGYLDKATICLDNNLNNRCDSDEIQTTSHKGSYTLTAKENIDLEKTPLIAYGGIDLDTNKSFNLILKAMASQKNITPLTTLTAELVLNEKISLQEAKKIVAKQLNISVEDIEKDPVKELEQNSDTLYKKALEVQKIIELSSAQKNPEEASNTYKKVAKAFVENKNLETVIDEITPDKVTANNIQAFTLFIEESNITTQNQDRAIKDIEKATGFVLQTSKTQEDIDTGDIIEFLYPTKAKGKTPQKEDTASNDKNTTHKPPKQLEKDTTPPKLTLIGPKYIELIIEDDFRDLGAIAIDNIDGDITQNIEVTGSVDNKKVGEYTLTYTVYDKAGNKSSIQRVVKVVDPYPYIPKGKDLSYETTFRFLEKTTFGPTQELIQEVQEKGVRRWLEEQLNQTYELNDSLVYQTLKMGQTINPFAYNHDISEYMAEDTTLYLPPWGSDHLKVKNYFLSSWFKDVFWTKKQLRARVAYALSQTIVASDSAGIFREKYHGLAAYYDLMKKHAFGNYGELLKEVSVSAAMGYYLTFYGNQKKHLNQKGEWVYPDENYAREVMQLFSISPFLLNMDGSKVLDKDGQPLPSYTQNDVNELARVFTGFDFRRAKTFGNTGTRGGDLLHKMECHQEYHDTEAKTVLGKTIPAGGDCYSDVQKAIDILINHQNNAPFIARKLIMRLAKSNPSSQYIQRVAQVYEHNERGIKGDIKETVRAIYLDREFWDDITNNRSMKYKEPLIAFTQMARAFHVKPYPKWHLLISSSDTKDIRDKKVELEDTGLIWIAEPSAAFAQGPTQSNTVFNFYSDDYIPSDDYFLQNKYVAPEIQIQTDGAFVAYHNYIYNVLLNEKNYALNKHGVNLYNPYQFKVYNDMKEFGNDLDMIFHPDKFYFDLTPYYKLVEESLKKELDGEDLEDILIKANEQKYLFSMEIRKEAIQKVVDLLDKELAGNRLNDEFKQMLVDKYAVKLRYYDSDDLRLFYMLVLKMLVQMVVIYDDYKVE